MIMTTSDRTYTYSAGSLNTIADGLSEDIRKEIDDRIVYLIKLNTMPDEVVIEAIIKDKGIFELLANPSEAVIDAYKFQYVL